MEFLINDTPLSVKINKSLLTGLIRALKVDDTCLLEHNGSFINAIHESETKYGLQYKDGKTGAIFASEQSAVQQKAVVEAFVSFFLQDKKWITNQRWTKTDDCPAIQPAPATKQLTKIETPASAPTAPHQYLPPPAPAQPEAFPYETASSNIGRRSWSYPAISAWEIFTYGAHSPNIHCQHCQTPGGVLVKRVTKKVGISGPSQKATAGILTGGLSLFVAGLSRKEAMTQAYCANCKAVWHF